MVCPASYCLFLTGMLKYGLLRTKEPALDLVVVRP